MMIIEDTKYLYSYDFKPLPFFEKVPVFRSLSYSDSEW